MDKVIKIGLIVLLICLILNLMNSLYSDREDLGCRYEYYPLRRDIKGPVDIPWKIVEYAYDENFIVATQKLRMGYPLDGYRLGGYDSTSISLSDVDGDHVVYWIVDKKNDKNLLCGDRQEFIKKCDSLGVSAEVVSGITY